MRKNTLLRTLTLIHQLSTGTHRINNLARHHKVTRRTIYRDLDVLAEAGFAVASDEAEGVWRIESRTGRCPVCGRK